MRNYWEASEELINFIKTHSTLSDVDELDDMLLFLRNMILTNDDKMLEGAQAWVDNMLEELDSKKAKYTKAVDRILAPDGSKACIYHACAYRDLKTLVGCSHSDVLQNMNLLERTEGWSDADMETMWRYFDELNRNAFVVVQSTAPRVPSRDEISRNIKSKKADTATPGLSMHKAFIVAYSALHERRNGSKPSLDEEGAERMKEDIHKRIDGEDVVAILDNKDQKAVDLAQRALPDIRFDGEELTKSDWDMVNQLLTMSKVQHAVPSGVMSQVEEFAHQLANDMVSGRRDITSLANIESLGEELMSKIDPKDISKISDGMDGLLPALQMLKSALPQSM